MIRVVGRLGGKDAFGAEVEIVAVDAYVANADDGLWRFLA